VPHPVLGEITAMSAPYVLSATPVRLERAGPVLGADNDYVYGTLLEISPSEYRSLEAEGLFA
jgi:crotonobetainyl-CoA:carnitine CoA-transferase CaiB-like acyl-CoA transferase